MSFPLVAYVLGAATFGAMWLDRLRARNDRLEGRSETPE